MEQQEKEKRSAQDCTITKRLIEIVRGCTEVNRSVAQVKKRIPVKTNSYVMHVLRDGIKGVT